MSNMKELALLLDEYKRWDAARTQLSADEEAQLGGLNSAWEVSDDQGIDLLRNLAAALTAHTEPEVERQSGARFAVKVKADATESELAYIRAALQPGDLAYTDSGPVLEVTGVGALEPRPTPEAEKPSTPYGVRIFYADETMEEIHDIAGIQVANLIDGTFPVGFMSVEEESLPVAGSWDAEGSFVPFEVKPERPGW